MLVEASIWLLSGFMIFVSGQITLPTEILSTEVWEAVPGTAVQISAKGDHLWAVTRYAQLLRWIGSGWKLVPYRATHVAAAADGAAYMIDVHYYGKALSQGGYDGNIYRYVKDDYSGNWLQSWAHTADYYFVAGNINAISYGKAVIAGVEGIAWFLREGSVIRLNATDTQTLQIAIGEGDLIWRVSVDGNLNSWSGTSWTADTTGFPEPGHARYIDLVSASRMVVTTSEGFVYVYDGSSWTRHSLSGNEICVQATISPTAVFCVDLNEKIWTLAA